MCADSSHQYSSTQTRLSYVAQTALSEHEYPLLNWKSHLLKSNPVSLHGKNKIELQPGLQWLPGVRLPLEIKYVCSYSVLMHVCVNISYKLLLFADVVWVCKNIHAADLGTVII